SAIADCMSPIVASTMRKGRGCVLPIEAAKKSAALHITKLSIRRMRRILHWYRTCVLRADGRTHASTCHRHARPRRSCLDRSGAGKIREQPGCPRARRLQGARGEVRAAAEESRRLGAAAEGVE